MVLSLELRLYSGSPSALHPALEAAGGRAEDLGFGVSESKRAPTHPNLLGELGWVLVCALSYCRPTPNHPEFTL